MIGFDPQKLFIGMMDFFSILLPGAVLTYLFMNDLAPMVLGTGFAVIGGTEKLAVFLFASYLTGHLVFLAGSWLDEVYDLLRNRTLNQQIHDMAKRGTMSAWLVRAVVHLIFKRERNRAVDRAGEIKKAALAPLRAAGAVNTYQWSKAFLSLENADGLAAVHRFEADSKFFRCFTIVLIIIILTWPLHLKWSLWAAPVLVVMLGLAAWRYAEQRFKATNQAYWAVITTVAKTGKPTLTPKPQKPGEPTHAGGVVYRNVSDQTEFLLVEATNDPNQWVLPKGHIEDSETPRETAVREVQEETGIWARITADLGCETIKAAGTKGRKKNDVMDVSFYLMEAVGAGWPKDKDRQSEWFRLEAAMSKAAFPETRALLSRAAALCATRGP